MGVRIVSDSDQAVLYCSTSMWAFGPVFGKCQTNGTEEEPEERAKRFCKWVEENGHRFESHPIGRPGDPRSLTNAGLERAHSEWLGDTSLLGGDPPETFTCFGCNEERLLAEMHPDHANPESPYEGYCQDCADMKDAEDKATYEETAVRA